MNTNKKVLIIVFIMLSLLSVATVVNVWVAFEKFGNKTTSERANSIAESARDGLTSHMVLGAMDKREMFLDNMKKHQSVKSLRVIRSQKLVKEYGTGGIDFYKYDDIEKKVLGSGETITKEITDKNNKYLRITIPYVATKNSNPNCLSCHTNVDEGEVLGAISLELDITDIENTTLDTIQKIILISAVFLIVAFFIAGYFIRPYVQLFDDLEEGISKAYKGDFSFSVSTTLTDEAGKVADKLNDLSEIFRFKKTIEHDDKKEKIYERMAHVLQTNFKIDQFVIMQHSVVFGTRQVVYKSEKMENVSTKIFETSNKECRAYRTNLQTCSTDFHKICDLCFKNDKESLCLPFPISDEVSLSLLIYTDTKTEIEAVKELIPIITNYFELAEPVLQTKLLMEKLQEKSLKDPMTGLYNRRFLDNYMENEIINKKQFSVMMLDVDFFKQVNDTHGHDVGDQVIKGLSEVIKNNIKGSDIAIRYGGEEFTVILFDIPMDKVEIIAQNIRKEFSKRIFRGKNESFSKTLSVGISLFPEDSHSPWETIKHADVALYNAKENGRNKVVLFAPSMYKEEEI